MTRTASVIIQTLLIVDECAYLREYNYMEHNYMIM